MEIQYLNMWKDDFTVVFIPTIGGEFSPRKKSIIFAWLVWLVEISW